MHALTIKTTPVDTQTDVEEACEQLREIASYDLAVTQTQLDRRARSATLTVSVSNRERFLANLAASKYARFYKVVG